MKKILVSILIIFISACGWHLRGSVAGNSAMSEPFSLMINATDNHSAFIIILRQALSNHRMIEVSETGTDIVELNIEKEVLDKRTAGVGSDALTSAYEIIIRVEYSVSKNSELLTPLKTTASLSRTYNYNVNNANGAAQEEALVLREMRQELAQTILRRVRSLRDKNNSAP